MAKGSNGRYLVIVESPAKARTIGKYLDSGYKVAASVGHVRDLPKKDLGVDVENGFEPNYVTIRGKGKVIKELRALARNVDTIILATDPDREGEAIAWHVAEELGYDKDTSRFRRVEFREVTKAAVRKALENPGHLDMKKVEAQQTRRILDRLVGYQVSPFLWKPVRPGLSAGRVQTVALRLICEREDEIKAFENQEYWSITAHLENEEQPFDAKLNKIEGKSFRLESQEKAAEVLKDIAGVAFRVTEVKRRERRKNPAAPFTTSTLQQEAAKRLRFSAKRTMGAAQRLYEGVALGKRDSVGLITYMRTDSTRVSPEAVEGARAWIRAEMGDSYVASSPRSWGGKQAKGAQEAHEAIRPTSVDIHPDMVRPYVDAGVARLYELIWLRFVASQMAPAIYDTTTLDYDLAGGSGRHYLFRATGSVIKFQGFTRLYLEAKESGDAQRLDDLEPLPSVGEGAVSELKKLTPAQHFTQPPARFSEASLVKELEALGIGRPSTYAQIISTLQDREYTELQERRFHPTPLGDTVAKLLVRVFPDIFDVKFTSRMEGELDQVEDGVVDWRKVLADFYPSLLSQLSAGKTSSEEIVKQILAADGETCDVCKGPMLVRWNKSGRFLGCAAYPECRSTRPVDGEGLPDLKGEKCTQCEGGVLAARSGRFGPFIACSNYPECRYTRPLEGEEPKAPVQESDVRCEKCSAAMAIKRGRFGDFLACTGYPKCKNTKPITIPGLHCPKCGTGEIAEKSTRKGKAFWGCVKYPDCDWSSWDRPFPSPCPSCTATFLLSKATRTKGSFLRCPSCEGEFQPDQVELPKAAS